MIFDFFVIFFILFTLKKTKTFSILNPLVLMLIFHVLFVSFIGIKKLLTDSLITNDLFVYGLNTDSLNLAILVADVSLLSFALAFLYKFLHKNPKNIPHFKLKKNTKLKLKFLILLTFLLGLIFLFLNTGSIFVNYLILPFVLYIYLDGFKKHFLFFLALVFLLFVLDGYHRYRVILPIIFLSSLYIKKHSFKLNFFQILAFIFLLPLFTSLKNYGNNNSFNNNLITYKNSFVETYSFGSTDFSFIEQSAAIIDYVESTDKFFYGETYKSIFFFFIPKSIWSDKPALNSWLDSISDKYRNFYKMGMVTLFSGEAYINFKFLGVSLLSFFLGLFYSNIFLSYRYSHFHTSGFFLLLLINMILFQVWRDGLISLFLFPIINYFPLVVSYLILRIDENFN